MLVGVRLVRVLVLWWAETLVGGVKWGLVTVYVVFKKNNDEVSHRLHRCTQQTACGCRTSVCDSSACSPLTDWETTSPMKFLFILPSSFLFFFFLLCFFIFLLLFLVLLLFLFLFFTLPLFLLSFLSLSPFFSSFSFSLSFFLFFILLLSFFFFIFFLSIFFSFSSFFFFLFHFLFHFLFSFSHLFLSFFFSIFSQFFFLFFFFLSNSHFLIHTFSLILHVTQVIAPVRESCAQVLGVVCLHLEEHVIDDVSNALLQLLSNGHNIWEVKHGGLLGIKYILATRQVSVRENEKGRKGLQ